MLCNRVGDTILCRFCIIEQYLYFKNISRMLALLRFSEARAGLVRQHAFRIAYRYARPPSNHLHGQDKLTKVESRRQQQRDTCRRKSMDRGRRAMPVQNKACYERHVQKCQDNHRQRLAKMKPTIDCHPPSSMRRAAAKTNAKKQQIMVRQ